MTTTETILFASCANLQKNLLMMGTLEWILNLIFPFRTTLILSQIGVSLNVYYLPVKCTNLKVQVVQIQMVCSPCPLKHPSPLRIDAHLVYSLFIYRNMQ